MRAFELRVRTLIELAGNIEFYDNKMKQYLHIDEIPIFSNFSDCVINRCSKINSFSGLPEILALSQVIRFPIQLHWPHVFPLITLQDPAAKIVPQPVVDFCYKAPLNIMWTRNVPHVNQVWTPNHFVPLVHAHLINVEELETLSNNDPLVYHTRFALCQDKLATTVDLDECHQVNVTMTEPVTSLSENVDLQYQLQPLTIGLEGHFLNILQTLKFINDQEVILSTVPQMPTTFTTFYAHPLGFRHTGYIAAIPTGHITPIFRNLPYSLIFIMYFYLILNCFCEIVIFCKHFLVYIQDVYVNNETIYEYM